jgi:hypothetical protein
MKWIDGCEFALVGLTECKVDDSFLDQSTNRPIDQSTNRPIDQSTNPSIKRMMAQAPDVSGRLAGPLPGLFFA